MHRIRRVFTDEPAWKHEHYPKPICENDFEDKVTIFILGVASRALI